MEKEKERRHSKKKERSLKEIRSFSTQKKVKAIMRFMTILGDLKLKYFLCTCRLTLVGNI